MRVQTLKRAANQLSLAADDHPGPGAAEAKHLSASLTKLANADAATRERAEHAFGTTLTLALGQLQRLLQPTEITRGNFGGGKVGGGTFGGGGAFGGGGFGG